MDDFEHSLQGIETLIDDPAVKAVIDKARLINEYIAEFPMGQEEATRAIEELNKEWAEGGLKGESMRFTGKAWIMDAPCAYLAGYEVSSEYFLQAVNQKIAIAGFTLLEKHTLTEEGIDTTQEVYLNGKTMIDDEAGVSGKSHVDVVGSLSESTLYYKGISPERAAVWLDFYRPDEKEEIINACLAAENDAEIVMNLRAFRVPLDGMNKGAVKELRKNLEIFLGDALSLEKHVPYLLESCGTIQVLDVNDKGEKEYSKHYILTEEAAFVIVENVLCRKSEDGKYLEPLLQAELVHKDKKTLTVCRIPFSEIENLESVREALRARPKKYSR